MDATIRDRIREFRCVPARDLLDDDGEGNSAFGVACVGLIDRRSWEATSLLGAALHVCHQ
jgi:hypothetical protein